MTSGARRSCHECTGSAAPTTKSGQLETAKTFHRLHGQECREQSTPIRNGASAPQASREKPNRRGGSTSFADWSINTMEATMI